MRIALGDAAPLYREAPEAEAARAGGSAAILTFRAEALLLADDAKQWRAAALIEMTLVQVGSSFSEGRRTGDEVQILADEMADMFDAYLPQG